MMDWQVSQPEAERVTYSQDQTSSRPMVNWGPDERSWSQNLTCRQVGNQIICDDIYGDNRPAVARASFSLQGNDAFRSIASLQMSMGLLGQSQIVRVSDTQAPPYFPPGTLPYSSLQLDQYGYNQGPKPGQIGPVVNPGTGALDPYSFNQGDRTPVFPVNPGIIPPYIKPGGHDVPLPPIPTPVTPPRPIDVPPPPVPQPQPRPDTNPYQPSPCQPDYNPCYPCHPRWYPGMIAGRVLGRIFGRRCR